MAIERWDVLRRHVAPLLRTPRPDAAWLLRLESAVRDLRALASQEPDAALYVLIHAAGHDTAGYSALHAMTCAVVADLVGRWHGWPDEECDALTHAALTMNLGMTEVQDALAAQTEPPTEPQRQAIDRHAEASVALLRGAGVADRLWLSIVLAHHRGADPSAPWNELPATDRLAETLRRIDIYTAKLSRRAHRAAIAPTLAARDACLGPAGRPDPVGATLLRVLGLYPPGTWVTLANGEVAEVIARGAKAHTPIVAAVRRADGGVWMSPMRRDTSQPGFAVASALGAGQGRIRLSRERMLSC